MTPEKLRAIENLFHTALERPEQDRSVFIREQSFGDEEMRRRLEALLRSHDTQFLGGAAVDSYIGRGVNHYRIDALIGTGGMAEVYRAHDTKLRRDVAFKVLPALSGVNDEQSARLRREAHLLATLNHPNIAAIYGFEESEGLSGLALELIEGETLAERLSRGSLPLNDALQFALGIASALEAAHEKGIVHRDIKPANIKIMSSGTVKVLDFGIAKMLVPGVSGESFTGEGIGTGDGLILGTVAYMSPEQARGQTTDSRSDVWSFGCVLYEMFTGVKLWGEQTAPDRIASILKDEPDWNALPADTPPAIRVLLRRCLEKDLRKRLPHIGAARLDIEDTLAKAPSAVLPMPDVSVSKNRGYFWPALAVFLLAVTVIETVPRFFDRTIASPEMRMQIVAPGAYEPGGTLVSPGGISISPDGLNLVYAQVQPGNRRRLVLRPLNSAVLQPLPDTDDARYPFWSPDSRKVAFFKSGKLLSLNIAGGPVETITSALDGRSGTWNKTDVIVFAPTQDGPLHRVSALGGESIEITQKTAGQDSHRFPVFLPDGQHFVFFVQGSPNVKGVYVGQLDGKNTHRLFDADSFAIFADGHLLFVRQNDLVAQKFDLNRLTTVGDPFLVEQNVGMDFSRNAADLSSAAGMIAYRARMVDQVQQLMWFDRKGTPLPAPGQFTNFYADSPSLSPDGHHLAFQDMKQGNGDVWILDLARGITTRFTSDPAFDYAPIWSRDQKRIAFASIRGLTGLVIKPVVGTDPDDVLLDSEPPKIPLDWSSDGRYLLFRSRDVTTGFDVWAFRMEDRKAVAVLNSRFNEPAASFSPNGQWLAFQSDESGRYEVYLQPFPGPGNKMQVSSNGGGLPRWRKDGKELFYIALDGNLQSVSLSETAGRIETSIPHRLFPSRVSGGPLPSNTSAAQRYDVTPDGQRFVIAVPPSQSAPEQPITVILNWKAQRPLK